jgi:hypothetical protein
MTGQPAKFDPARAAALMGVKVTATEQELRAAYLEQIRRHPPDREPDLFEQIRDAYEGLKNPDVRASAVLSGPDPAAPLATILDGLEVGRRFIGSDLWISLLKEKRS